MKYSKTSSLVMIIIASIFLMSCEEEKFYEKEYLNKLDEKYENKESEDIELEQSEDETTDNSEAGDENNSDTNEEVEEEVVEKDKELGEIIEEIHINCNDAKDLGVMKVETIRVDFPAAIECSFNDHGTLVTDLNDENNGPRKNQRIRARIEQTSKVTLPSEATLCDIDFSFPKQSMQYDDEIILLLNNYVMMSSTNYSKTTNEYKDVGLNENEFGFQEYKWMGDNSLYNLFYDHNVTPKYCLGIDPSDPEYNDKCFLPKSEQLGQIKLDLPKEEIIKMGAISKDYSKSSTGRVLDFGFVTTGDNDRGDCEHSAYSFEVTVQYTEAD